jgi:hypothetical protein
MAFRTLFRTAVALPLALAMGCSHEPPTGPDVPVSFSNAHGGGGAVLTAPSGPIVSNGGVVPLDDPNAGGVPYTIAIINSGSTLHDVVLEGYVTQISQAPTAQHIAGSAVINCGGSLGTVPKGTCNTGFTITASNALDGPGTLVPGAASFDLLVLDRKGNLLLFTSAPITLQ